MPHRCGRDGQDQRFVLRHFRENLRYGRKDLMVDTEFIHELASKAPTPGGGGASAYCGALASALASMVGNLTVGKKKYAAVEDLMQEALSRLEACRSRLIELVDADAAAFAPLAAAYGMPKETSDQQTAKDEAMQHALVQACQVPVEIMEECARVIELCDSMAKHGSRLAVSDAGVAALFAKAALQGASLNVYINASSMKDREAADSFCRKADELIRVRGVQADDVYAYVMAEVR